MARNNKAEIKGDIVIYSLLTGFAVFCIYPILYVFANAVSEPEAVKNMDVFLWPVGFTFKSWKYIIEHQYIGKSYLNSVFYTTAGTSYSLALTTLGAYILSRKNFVGRNLFMFLIWFTMMFGGGLIPTFLVVNTLGMVNTRWALIIPCAISQYYLIIMRTSMLQIPDSLEESATIDGAGPIVIMFKIILPVSIPTIATIALFLAVARWNDYFTAIIYLNNKGFYPLQAILRELIVTFTDTSTDMGMMNYENQKNFATLGFRCATILCALIPPMAVYPFVQKYFVKGVMIGSIKG